MLISVAFLQLAREVLDIAAKAVRVGITTDEIDRIVHEVNSELIMKRTTSIVNFCMKKNMRP